MTVKYTEKQKEAIKLAGSVIHSMAYGGSRSGKTFIDIRNICVRAFKAPFSRHLAVRKRFNSIKRSIVLDTFPKVMKLCFPDVRYHLDKTDWYITFENGSEFWFGGLDDKERAEKILGNEYATIYLNESSEISWSSVIIVLTRLAQNVMQVVNGKETTPLVPRMYYDCNPPKKSHWTYKLFVKKVDPETKHPLPNPDDYGFVQMNPNDNADNLPGSYLKSLQSMGGRHRKRFYEGNFEDDNPNALFQGTLIDEYRNTGGELPDFIRIIVSVDPSGAGDTDNQNNDAIGICVVGLGVDGKGYLLEDCTVKAGPATWGSVVVNAYIRHNADCIIGEKNYGGEMVRFVIKAACTKLKVIAPFKFVVATRGKVVRAEPISVLYEQGKVIHVGYFQDLEDELEGFSTSGYTGELSPNRADALIWGITELFPGITTKREKIEIDIPSNTFGW